jgi:uncharacterized protein (TIGR03790 family)
MNHGTFRRSNCGVRLARLFLGLLFAPLLARAGGDEVVVVYNTRLPASKMVAEHYAAARKVPAKQVFGFALTTNETMSRADFTDLLQTPLADKLERNRFWKLGEVKIPASSNHVAQVEYRVVTSKIRYAVLCYGVPLKIAQSQTPDPLAEKIARPELRNDQASVDSELAWLPLTHMRIVLPGPLPNSLYCCTNHAVLNPAQGILLVSRLDGPTPEIANALVDKALAAERDGLWGRAYLDIRNLQTNDAFYPGDLWMRQSAEICRRAGFDTEMDANAATFPETFPMSQIGIYAGWYDGDVSGPFRLPKVEFMPGAFAYHLHSFSAETLRSDNSHWCGPLLAKGATCTMGCVNEPYLALTPNVAFFLEAIFSGYTFAEAAWAAQPALSWQTTAIGDPLYQPFAKAPLERHVQLARDKNPLIEWSFERMVNLDAVRGAPAAQLAAFLEDLPATTNSAVLTEKLASIEDTAGKPSSAIDSWQAALKRSPSPNQRIRIRLALGEKLLLQGREAEAVADYKQLLAEAPEYPGKTEIEEKLRTLEQKPAAANSPTEKEP